MPECRVFYIGLFHHTFGVYLRFLYFMGLTSRRRHRPAYIICFSLLFFSASVFGFIHDQKEDVLTKFGI